jgi:hypothetical protein
MNVFCRECNRKPAAWKSARGERRIAPKPDKFPACADQDNRLAARGNDVTTTIGTASPRGVGGCSGRRDHAHRARGVGTGEVGVCRSDDPERGVLAAVARVYADLLTKYGPSGLLLAVLCGPGDGVEIETIRQTNERQGFPKTAGDILARSVCRRTMTSRHARIVRSMHSRTANVSGPTRHTDAINH